MTPLLSSLSQYGGRAAIVVAALVLWHLTQSWIGRRQQPAGFVDRIHIATASWHAWLTRNTRPTNALLIISSLGIDVCGLTIILVSILGPSMEPFVALMLLFALRQVCQAACPLPPPDGMIWRYPGFPSLLVTYGVSNDLFFSGHTALVTLAAWQAWQIGPPWLATVAIIHAVWQAGLVIVLRAHYTLDVLAGAWAAWFVADVTHRLWPMFE